MNQQVLQVIIVPLITALLLGCVIGWVFRDLSLRKIWKLAELEWDHHQREQLARRDASITGLKHRTEAAEKASAAAVEKANEEKNQLESKMRDELQREYALKVDEAAKPYLLAQSESLAKVNKLQRELSARESEVNRLKEIVEGHDEQIRHIMSRRTARAVVSMDPELAEELLRKSH